MSNFQGNVFKTHEERALLEPYDYFLGCYFSPGFTTYAFSGPSGVSSGLFLWFIPYTHFTALWSNVAGYTAMRGRSFGSAEARMSPEELAIASLPVPPNAENAMGTTLFPQSSTFNFGYKYYNYNDIRYTDKDGGTQTKSTCPNTNSSSLFCSEINYATTCEFSGPNSPTENSPSFNDTLGLLVLMALFYTMLAAWWAQVLPAGNGAPQKPWFFLLPSYWRGSSRGGNDGKESSQVAIREAKKKFGDFEAVKGVSLSMECGEVTALLGHNGAGSKCNKRSTIWLRKRPNPIYSQRQL